MEAKDFILNDCRQRQEIEQICVIFPNICIAVFAQTLIVEAVDLRNLPGLVIAPENCDSFLKPDLECHQQGDRLH